MAGEVRDLKMESGEWTTTNEEEHRGERRRGVWPQCDDGVLVCV
jgi:hypothetical protein